MAEEMQIEKTAINTPKVAIKTKSKKNDVQADSQAEVQNKVKQVIYIGPTFNNGDLTQFTVFNNDLPEHVKEHAEQCKALQALFIPISELAEARPRLLIKGTGENTMFEKVLKYINGGD